MIRHYAPCRGIGDDNPIMPIGYAEAKKWGTIIAPPTFFFALWDAVVAPGLPDVQWYYSGIDAGSATDQAQRHDPARRPKLHVAARAAVHGKTVSNMIVQTGDVRYHDHNGRLMTKVLSHCFRVAAPPPRAA